MRAFLFFTLVCTTSCGKAADKAPEPGSAAAPTPGSATAPKPAAPDAAPAVDAAAPAAPTLAATLTGKPVSFTSAVATSRGNEIRIYLANYPHTCEEAVSGSSARASTPDDVDSEIAITPYLAPAGAGWGLHGSYLHRTEPGTTNSQTFQTEKEDGAFPMAAGVDFAAVAAAGATTEIPLEYKTGSEDQLVVKGTIKVTGCGPTKRAADPTPAALGDGTMTFAGKTLPIGGAGIITKKDGTRELQLGTHPVKCVDGSDYTSTRSDAKITLTFSKSGVLTHAARGGYWVDWGVNQTDKIGLTATPNRAPGGAKTLAVKLGGETEIEKLSVALAGKVDAIVCPTPK